MISTDVFIIGAGMAGLTLAQQLKQQGTKVVCVDKARGSGGRLSSKRVQGSQHTVSFDLGALSFVAKTQSFKHVVQNWCEQKHLAHWLNHNHQDHYVGTPRSSSLTRALADEVGAQFGVRITAVVKNDNGWSVFVGQDVLFAHARHVVFASPAPQTHDLIPNSHALKATLVNVTMEPQWVSMFALQDPLNLADLTHGPNANIAAISYENSKPQRNNDHGLHVYCVQASHQWSKNRVEYSKDKVIYELADELTQLCHEPLRIKVDYAHRWLYASRSNLSADHKDFLSSDDGLFVCGDYMNAHDDIEGVEAAYLSGLALASHLNQFVLNAPLESVDC